MFLRRRIHKSPFPLKFFDQSPLRKRVVYYSVDSKNVLTGLFEKYGSDKGSRKLTGLPYPWPPHTYSDLYDSIWGQHREKIGRVFECGIGTSSSAYPANMGPEGIPGASLHAWRDYFVNAEIYGADIDREVLIDEERIKTHWVDQLSEESIKLLWAKIGNEKFDVILDDGLHTFEAGSTLFANSIHALADDGVYVIEDVSPSDLLAYAEFFKPQSYFVEYHIMSAEHETRDNNVIVVRK